MLTSDDTTIVATTKNSTTPNRSTGSARQSFQTRSTHGKTARGRGSGPDGGGWLLPARRASAWSVLTGAPRRWHHHGGGAAGPTYRHVRRAVRGRAGCAGAGADWPRRRSFRATDTGTGAA